MKDVNLIGAPKLSSDDGESDQGERVSCCWLSEGGNDHGWDDDTSAPLTDASIPLGHPQTFDWSEIRDRH